MHIVHSIRLSKPSLKWSLIREFIGICSLIAINEHVEQNSTTTVTVVHTVMKKTILTLFLIFPKLIDQYEPMSFPIIFWFKKLKECGVF